MARTTPKIAPPLGGYAPPSNTWFRGPIRVPKRHVDQFSRFCTAHCRVSRYFTICRYVPPKIAIPPGGSGSPSNTWYLGPTRVINLNGISTGSAVFALVPNAMLYNALSMGNKTPKSLLPLGLHHPIGRGPSHGDRQRAQKNR